MFKDREVRARRGVGRHTPIGAAEDIARAISKGIEEHGTRPHWFVRDSLPEIGEHLSGVIAEYMEKAFARAARDTRFQSNLT